MNGQAAAGWFPDPFGRHQHRWWNGFNWTEHVASAGHQTIDPPVVAPPSQAPMAHAHRNLPSHASPTVSATVQSQVRRLGVADAAKVGGGTLFTEQILVVNQKAKLFERKAEYSVFNQHGRKVAGVRQVGISMSSMVVGRDSATKRLQIVDDEGRLVLALTRPAKVLKSKVTVLRGDGTPVGQIVQENLGIMASVLGGRFNIRFRMESNSGETLATLNAESWRAWDFSIQDPNGAELARITKTWAGLRKELFTKADNYVLEMHRPLEEPLLSLVISAALTVDTVLKQDSDQRSR